MTQETKINTFSAALSVDAVRGLWIELCDIWYEREQPSIYVLLKKRLMF